MRGVWLPGVALACVGVAHADRAEPARPPARLYQPGDSIGLASLQRVPGEESGQGTIRVSRDERWIAFVAHRGDAISGLIEYRIYIYDAARVRAFASGRETAPPPRHIALFQTDGNLPAVRDFHWLNDDSRLAIIGERRASKSPAPGGERPQLYLLDVNSGALDLATDSPNEVLACDAAGETVLCLTATESLTSERADTRSAYVVEDSLGATLGLGPRSDDRDQPVRVAVYVREGAAPGRIVAESVGQTPREQLRVRLSPTARQAVVTWPLERIKPEWSRYEIASEFDRLEPAYDEKHKRYTQFALVDIAAGSLRPAIDAPTGDWLSGSYAPTDAFWSPDGRALILSSTYLPAAESHTGPAIVELDASSLNHRLVARLPVLHSEDFDQGWPEHVRSIALSNDGTTLDLALSEPAGTAREESRIRRFVRSAAGDWSETTTNKQRPALKSHSKDVAQVPLILGEEMTLTTPPRVTVHLGDARTSRVLIELNAHLQDVQLGEIRVIQWRDANGRAWEGGLVLPPAGARAARPFPLVIQTHGFPRNEFLIDGPMTTGYAAQGLAARGIAVLQIGDAHDVMDTGDEAPTHMAAYESAIDYLEKEGWIDARRVGLMGFSRTCYHVRYALTHSPRRFAAALTADGVDFGYWQYLLSASSPDDAFAKAWRTLAERLNSGRPFASGLGNWLVHAPGFQADRISAPLGIIALTTDTVLGQWEIYAALKILGRPVEMLVIPDAPHELVRPRDRLIAMEYTIGWFDYWLNGREDLDAGKTERNARWRELRKRQTVPDGPRPH